MSTDTPQRQQHVEHVVEDPALLERAGLADAFPVCGAAVAGGHDCDHSDVREVCGACCPRCL